MDSSKGLTHQEAEILLKQWGKNAIPEKKKHTLKKIILWVISPVSLMLLATAFLSLYLGKTADFYIILFLFFSNFGISFWHERKADQSIEKLQKNLAVRVRVLRDGTEVMIDSFELVPGDLIRLSTGAIIPADAKIIEAQNLSANESVLTGESLPKQKEVADTLYSGSFIATGIALASVTATGIHTSFGNIIASIDETPKQSSLEKDILAISKLISIVSVTVVAILTIIFTIVRIPLTDTIILDLSLLIAGIPVALPTVMSLIISIGVLGLAKKKAVVRRLASLEDLANVNLLLSDKTGTLTENKVRVEQVMPLSGFTEQEIIAFALGAICDTDNNPLDHAISEKAQEIHVAPYEQTSFVLADSNRKRSSGIVQVAGVARAVSLGASQAIEPLCLLTDAMRKVFEQSLVSAAKKGYRVLALAVSQDTDESNMDLAGILLLADTIRSDAKETIAFMEQNGIAVKMVTGDSFAIGQEVAHALDLSGQMYQRDALDNLDQVFESASGFSEVLPKDKYALVNFAQQYKDGKYIVAATGDGVNDLPALKAANVSFAVSNAVDALKSSADIVLLSSGISVIKDAIVEARNIFTRLYNYSLYRISESLRLIITIAVLGVLYRAYPLTPVQLIVLAFLNDIPIVSLAFDRVKASPAPAHINAKERFTISGIFGLVGIANSLILFFIMMYVLHLPWPEIETMFFLKLTVSGHLLVYVAHTKERWWKFLPAKQVIWATLGTQLLATAFALSGIFVAPISIGLVLFVWAWSFFWMQIGEVGKVLGYRIVQP
jgi:H+-transporting ATPase